MRVFLIGYMGVGKTTIGKKLAKRLGLRFIDLDDYITSNEYASIAQVIENIGEDYFRNIERHYLLEVTQMEDVLISTGGGTPCFFDHMTLINDSGVSVYLKMDKKSLTNRLKNGMDNRPLLKGKKPEELEGFIEDHLKERKPFYEQAHIAFDALNMNSERIEELAELIEGRN